MYIAVVTKGFCLHKRTSFASFLRIHKQVIAVLTQSGCILIIMILPAVKFDHLSNHLLLSLSFYIKLILAHFLSFITCPIYLFLVLGIILGCRVIKVYFPIKDSRFIYMCKSTRAIIPISAVPRAYGFNRLTLKPISKLYQRFLIHIRKLCEKIKEGISPILIDCKAVTTNQNYASCR